MRQFRPEQQLTFHTSSDRIATVVLDVFLKDVPWKSDDLGAAAAAPPQKES